MANIFNSNPYQQNMSVKNMSVDTPNRNIDPTSIFRTNQYTLSPKTQTLGTDVGTTVSPVDNTQAPIVPANTSDTNAQITSLLDSVKNIQTQLDSYKNNTQTPIKEPSKEPSPSEKMFSSITGAFNKTQDQIGQSQQNLQSQANDIYAQWGLTPDNYKKIQDIASQIGDYQKQLADLDSQEQQAISDLQNRPGTDQTYVNAGTSKIQRDFAIKKAGIAANASVLASLGSALQGNWDNAMKSAQLYVDNATKAQQQVVSDLKWGFEQYSSLINTMTTAEQNQINFNIQEQDKELTRQQTDYWNKVTTDLQARGVDIQEARYGLEVAKYNAEQSGASQNAPYLANQVLSRSVSLTGNALSADEKKSVLNYLGSQGLAVPRPLTAAEKQAADNATSGLQAVQDLRYMYQQQGDNILLKGSLPTDLWKRLAGASEWVTASKEAADIKTRIRTGAALNNQEISFYSQQVPKFGDSQQAVEYKLNQLEGFYLGISGLQVTVTDPKGNSYTFQDLFDPQQRLGLRQAINEGYSLAY